MKPLWDAIGTKIHAIDHKHIRIDGLRTIEVRLTQRWVDGVLVPDAVLVWHDEPELMVPQPPAVTRKEYPIVTGPA